MSNSTSAYFSYGKALRTSKAMPDAHALRAHLEDRVGGEEPLVLGDVPRELLAEGQRLLHPAVGDVLVDAARPEVDVVQAAAGGLLEEVEDLLPLAEAPEEHRGRAQVGAPGPQPDQVTGDALELQEDHAQPLRPLWHHDLAQRLHGAEQSLFVGQ